MSKRRENPPSAKHDTAIVRDEHGKFVPVLPQAQDVRHVAR